MNKGLANKLKKIPFLKIGVIFLIVISLILIFIGKKNNNQSSLPIPADVSFVGEYKIGNGEWNKIEPDKHISSTSGDVTLRGYFEFYHPVTGKPIGKNFNTKICFYFDHLGATLETSNGENIVFDSENQQIGESSCGKLFLYYVISGDENTVITITLSNPHKFGNEMAVDNFLQNVQIAYGIEFEKQKSQEGAFDRYLGWIFIISACIILGVAIFFSIMKLAYKKEIILIGFMILFAGIHCIFNSQAIYFWNSIVYLNTFVLEFSAMFFMIALLFLLRLLTPVSIRKAITASCAISVLSSIVCVMISLLSTVYFYDTWPIFVITQSVALIIALIVLLVDLKGINKNQKIIRSFAILFFVSLLLDFIMTAIGVWQGIFLSKWVFCIIYVITLISVLKVIPQNLSNAMRAKELLSEKQALKLELQKSRVSLMLSQIKPHFIYNTLGTIGEFCESKPTQAKQLVQDFSLYLRGNFGELDNMNPIPVRQEIEHVKHYVKIENVRFPDMVITFDLQSDNFFIPALSVQPLVENAIKHGLLKLEKGGAVTVKTYETPTDYCISVADNGVGFDTSANIDEKKHIGIRNIRDRLKLMCDGKLTIQSEIGVGTTAVISIPKEKVDESNNG